MGPKLLYFFVIGDILGTGIYALTGTVAGKVGGALWLPFLIAFIVAFLTAFTYLELVGKYPRAAGAALYTNRAFKKPFLTFLVAFAVMCSGITSASAAALAFGGTYLPAALDITLSERDDRGRRGRVHRGAGGGQLHRRRPLGEGERRPDLHRAVRPRDHHLCRRLRGRRRQGRAGPAHRGQHRGHQLAARDHRGQLARVLRDGRVRGLGQHGRGVQGTAEDLPEGDARRPRHGRRDLRAGRDHVVAAGGRGRAARPPSPARCSR